MELRNMQGGVNGIKYKWEECETAYNVARGIECYERMKDKLLAEVKKSDSDRQVIVLGRERALAPAILAAGANAFVLKGDPPGQLLHQFAGHFQMLVDGQAEPEAELGAVLKQRVVPGGAPSVPVRRPRRGREVPPVD